MPDLFSCTRAAPAPWEPIAKTETLALLLSAALSLALVALSILDSGPLVAALSDESGPIEWFGAAGWFVLAALTVRLRGRLRYALPIALLCAVFALRELDLHHAFGSTSIFNRALYRDDAIPGVRRAAAAATALAILALFLWVTLAGTADYVQRRLYRTSAGRLVALAIVLVISGQTLDRGTALLRKHLDMEFPASTALTMRLLEESWESLAPLLLSAVAWTARRRG